MFVILSFFVCYILLATLKKVSKMRKYSLIYVMNSLIVSFCYGEQIKGDFNFTFTYDMASLCKEHICRKGYTYESFYALDSEDRKLSKDPEIVLEMHIAILASSNGHVLLSTVPHPEASDPVYEIVIGGGANKFTELRRNLRRNAKTSAKTFAILSAIEFRAFYIRISEDGNIEFGKEGSKIPILSYFDVDPVPVKYFSFASWAGVEAKFLYDCPAPSENGTTGKQPDSKIVEPKLTPSQKLKQTLLEKRSPHTPPGETVSIKLEVEVTSVNYNAYDAKLTTGLSIYTSWTDDSMAWDPRDHNGTTRLSFRQGQIWRPTFFVFNSGDMGAVDTRNPELIWMFHSGEAVLHFDTHLKTWCADFSSGLTKWPRDEYNCFVVIGPWEAHEKIKIEQVGTDDSEVNNTLPDIDDIIETEWEMVVKQGIVPHPAWNLLFNVTDNETYQSDRFLIKINLKRRALTYDIVFYTPLVVLVIFFLMSFCTEPLQMSRVLFYGSMTIILCMGLCYIDYLIPCNTIPFILVIYVTLLVAVLLSLMAQVLMMGATFQKLCKGEQMQRITTSRIFRSIFCLTPIKTCSNYHSINEAYNAQEDDDSGVVFPPRVNIIEEMETEDTKRSEAHEVAEAIDKLMLFVYSIVFAVMLCV